MSALLRFAKVACSRGGRLLFRDMDFELGAGSALLVTGPNGSGKSSLLRLAAGLLEPEGGFIERTRCALADDNLALDRELPLANALGFWGREVGDALEALALSELATVPVRLLSAGQSKRATLARLAASEAPLWLLDEPLNGLDATGIELVQCLLDRHRKAGGAVVTASHVPLEGEWECLDLTAEGQA